MSEIPRLAMHAATTCREWRNIVCSVCCFVTRPRRAAIFPHTPEFIWNGRPEKAELERRAMTWADSAASLAMTALYLQMHVGDLAARCARVVHLSLAP